MRRILGFVMILIGLSGIVLSIVGIIYGNALMEQIGDGLEANLTLTIDSLDTIRESLILSKSTVASVTTGMEAVELTAADASTAIENLRPLLSQTNVIVSQEIPQSVEAFQDTMPQLVEVATSIDETLTVLSSIRILGLSLGVDYQPEVPLGESVQAMGASLEGLPEDLRALEGSIEVTNENLQLISTDIELIAETLDTINTNFAQFGPLLDDYIVLVTEVRDNTSQSRQLLAEQIYFGRIVLTVLMTWLGLTQVAPLYLGWELVNGRDAHI
ncbi:MAG: hypothetical protein R3272_11940 [Candidatus Promineifilaceae bacterium]|nr:hypothetical protein [Candidatus Promineifilaceae bacterium]